MQNVKSLKCEVLHNINLPMISICAILLVLFSTAGRLSWSFMPVDRLADRRTCFFVQNELKASVLKPPFRSILEL